MKLFKGVFYLHIILFVLLFQVQQSSAQPGLIGCYPLDNHATDFSGNNYHGTAFNLTPVSDRFGNANSAYHFSGSSSYVQIPTTGYLINEYSYSVWCKPTNLPDAAMRGYYSVIAIGAAGIGTDQMILLGNDNQAGFIGFGGGSWSSTFQPHQCYVGTLPAINQWYHLVVTRNNTLLTLYVNGTQICTTNYASVNAGYSGSSIRGSIGSREVANEQNFVGDIDDVRIFNRVLTQTEIQNMSNACVCPLTVDLGTDTSVCSKGSFILDAGNPGSTFTWYLNGSIIQNAIGQLFHPQQSGQYTVMVNTTFCSVSDSINVTIHNPPVVLASQDVSICSGTSATLSASGSNTYHWSPAKSLNSTLGSMVVASPNATTTYTVTGIDSTNCSNQDSVTVTVHPSLTATIIANGPTTFCAVDSVTLTSNSATSYLWSNGATAQSITTGATGHYVVTVTDSNFCSATSAITTVTVNNCPIQLNMRVFIEGYYRGGDSMLAVVNPVLYSSLTDVITIELHRSIPPYDIAYVVSNYIDVHGYGIFYFPFPVSGNSYYIVVKHRNSLETWSKYPVLFDTPIKSYDFTRQ